MSYIYNTLPHLESQCNYQKVWHLLNSTFQKQFASLSNVKHATELTVDAFCSKDTALFQDSQHTEKPYAFAVYYKLVSQATSVLAVRADQCNCWRWEADILTGQFLICCILGSGIIPLLDKPQQGPKDQVPTVIEARTFFLSFIHKESN